MTEHANQPEKLPTDMNTVCAPAPIDQLATALSKAQAKLTNPPKNKTAKIVSQKGGSYKYSYADLADILDAVRPVLSEFGLALTQIVTRLEGANVLLTRLLHTSGQYLESIYALPAAAGPQEMGGAITYARRYSICPMLGIAGETDDDAQAADEAAETVELEQKRKATERLEELKAKGKLRSAHDGHVIQPGEDTDKPPSTETSGPGVPAAPTSRPEPPTGTPVKIDPRLDQQLKRDGVTLEQLKTFAVTRNLLPADMDMSKLEEGFIKACLDNANWKKVVASTKGAK